MQKVRWVSVRKHYYLDKIKLKPYFYETGKDKRDNQWKKERKKYGFDERETWSMNFTMITLLYERLKMYDEVNIVNTDYHKITIDEIERTQQWWMDELVQLCELYFECDEFDCDKYSEKIWGIWSVLSPYMWW